MIRSTRPVAHRTYRRIMNLATFAGSISTILFAASALPMLLKAAHTRDLSSYSVSNLWLINLANVVHSAYVFSLPVGPIWVLHSFYVVSSALMLVGYLVYRRAWQAAKVGSATHAPRRRGVIAMTATTSVRMMARSPR
jgi:hypothetical protein